MSVMTHTFASSLTIGPIKRATLFAFNMPRADLEGPSKRKEHVYPRHIAMYLSRSMTDKSFPQIARAFGDRDHTTVVYACQKVAAQIHTDPELAADIKHVTAIVLANNPLFSKLEEPA